MFLLILLSFLLPHDFHVSRMVMDYKAEEEHMEVSLHVFTDDLEYALQNRGHDSLRLNTKREISTADSLIADYLMEVIQLNHESGKSAMIRYLGKEASKDYMATWIYFYIELPENKGEYNMKTSLLTEIYDDQQNIVNLRGTKNPKLSLLTREEQEFIFHLP
jgi:hypothetical protein